MQCVEWTFIDVPLMWCVLKPCLRGMQWAINMSVQYAWHFYFCAINIFTSFDVFCVIGSSCWYYVTPVYIGVYIPFSYVCIAQVNVTVETFNTGPM